MAPHHSFDVAVIGAGPIGASLASELSRCGLSVVLVDRRPPPAEDALRPQLLVAREADLARLANLGVDVDDPDVVAPIESLCRGDLVRDWCRCDDAEVPEPVLDARYGLNSTAFGRPAALVPIGRLQAALVDIARANGADVRYWFDVSRLRRHARAVSLSAADGSSVRATVAIVATGARRSLATGELRVGSAPRRLMGGVFAVPADTSVWLRAELPIGGFSRPGLCTLLQTCTDTGAGTALLVDAPARVPTDAQLRECFWLAARAHGLAGAHQLVPPAVFETAVATSDRRVVDGDGRAPVLVAGDAAQTGHVFTGATCFVNLALAVELATALCGARAAIVDRRLRDTALVDAFARYERASAHGAHVLARASRPHFNARSGGT